jgi:membrane protein DedA with SNARE-associated domain
MNLHAIFDSAVSSLIAFISEIGYLGIFIGMFLESTPFPLPSELIMIPAGIAASHGVMNLYLVIVFGVLGNLAGAIFSYFVAVSVGRAILFKVGRYFFLKPSAIIKIENFFNSHGEISIFIGRIIPGVRHLISLPAGVAKMNFIRFFIYTFLGSALWSATLTVLGYFIGKNQDLIKQYLHLAVIGAIIFCVVLVVVYVVINKRNNKILHVL